MKKTYSISNIFIFFNITIIFCLVLTYLNLKYKYFFYLELTLLITIAFSFSLGMLVFFGFIMPYRRVSQVLTKIADGDIPENLPLDSSFEINRLRRKINRITHGLKMSRKIIQDIEKGNLNEHYTTLSSDKYVYKEGLLGSLLNMRSKMQDIAKVEQQRNWITEGLAKFSDVLRKNENNLKTLSDNVISNLVRYLNANQGGIFMLNEDDISEKYLELIACYAFERKKYIHKRLELNEGLVGQCFLEKANIYLKEVPTNYINIASGLGDAPPNIVLLVPLKVNNDIHGVLELASFKEFAPYQIEFIEKIGESIASTISSVKVNESGHKLLKQLKEQTEDMKAQEEELRQNMEEMQATQEEMRRTQDSLTKQEANLSALIDNTPDTVININQNYEVVVINQALKKRYKNTEYSNIAVGTNVLDMLPDDIREEWKAYYDRGLKGEKFDFIIKSAVSSELSNFRHYYINPVKNECGEILGVSVFSRDVTQEKNLEMNNKTLKQQVTNQKTLSDILHLRIVLDENQKIIEVNDLFLQKTNAQKNQVLNRKLSSLLKDNSIVSHLIETKSQQLWHYKLAFTFAEDYVINARGVTQYENINGKNRYKLSFINEQIDVITEVSAIFKKNEN